MKSLPWWAWVVGILVIVLAIGGGVLIGREMSPDSTQEESETTATADADTTETNGPEDLGGEEAGGATQTVRVYFARGEYLGVATRTIPETTAVARAAMEELLAGPTAQESAWGFTSEVPDGTSLLGISIEGGTARVDLSGEYDSGGGTLSMTMRLAQVAYTLTQFSTVERVVLLMDGEVVEIFGGEGIMIDDPMVRSDFEYVLPAIFVESPTPGDTVTSPVRLWGTANTFEAMFMVRITGSDGGTIVEVPAQATSGTGTRGTFDVSVSYPLAAGGNGAVVVYEESAADGSDIHLVEIPVTLGP